MRIGRCLLSFLLALLILIDSSSFKVLATGTPADIPDNFSESVNKSFEFDEAIVTFRLDDRWDGGYCVYVNIENTGEEDINGWCIQFNPIDQITGVWSAEMSTPDHRSYNIKNPSWNSRIAPGSSVEFGYSCNGDFKGFPSECKMLDSFSESCIDDCTIEYCEESSWDDSFLGRIIITNNSSETINGWCVEFFYSIDITDIWSARLISCEDHIFKIGNLEYNSTIAPGESLEFGFVGTRTGDENAPSDYELRQASFGGGTSGNSEDHHDENEDNNDEVYYKVTFNCLAEDAVNPPQEQNVLKGSCAETPTSPSLPGYSFLGWFLRSNSTTEYDFSTPVNSDIVLYARWKQVTDNLSDDIIDLGDIEYLKAMGHVDVTYSKYGDITSIYGSFYDKKIKSTADAANFLNASSSLWGEGFTASTSDIFVQSAQMIDETINYYRYCPSVNGVSVFGSQITLMVDSEGSLYAVLNSYDERINRTNTTPRVSENEAKATAMEYLLSLADVQEFLDGTYSRIISTHGEDAVTYDELVDEFMQLTTVDSDFYIYCESVDDKPRLVYEVAMRNMLVYQESEDDEDALGLNINHSVYIDANTGEVFRIVSNNRNLTVVAKDALGKERSIDVTYEDGEYILEDTKRGIKTYKATEIKDILWIKYYELPGALVSAEKTAGLDKEAVSVHANAEYVYDYYKNKLYRDSYDGKGSQLSVCYNYNTIEPFCAYWDYSQKWIVFQEDKKNTYCLDVFAHEYTHAVIDYIVVATESDHAQKRMERSGETGALNESYSDIMGAIIEGKSNEEKWSFAEDSGKTQRDLSNPNKYNCASHYSDMFSGKWSYENRKDNGGIHTYSGIFSLAAYKMMTDDRTSEIADDTWARVFYHSLYGIPVNSKFLQARESIIITAKKCGFTREQQQAIADAFDRVGIIEPDALRIVLTWGATPTDLDVHLVGPASEAKNDRFHLYYGTKDIGSPKTDDWIADLDYDDRNSYGPEVVTLRKFVPGTYYFYIYDYTTTGAIGTDALSNSNATVKIYRGADSTPLYEYKTTPGARGYCWNVFEMIIDSKQEIHISPINTYANSFDYF